MHPSQLPAVVPTCRCTNLSLYQPFIGCTNPATQYPHRGVRELGFLPERHGVYISRWHHGSPAHRYGLYALHWVSGEACMLLCMGSVLVGCGGMVAGLIDCATVTTSTTVYAHATQWLAKRYIFGCCPMCLFIHICVAGRPCAAPPCQPACPPLPVNTCLASSYALPHALLPTHCAEVNGQPTPDLDSFIEVVRRLPDGADARVRLIHYESSKSKVGWSGPVVSVCCAKALLTHALHKRQVLAA